MLFALIAFLCGIDAKKLSFSMSLILVSSKMRLRATLHPHEAKTDAIKKIFFLKINYYFALKFHIIVVVI